MAENIVIQDLWQLVRPRAFTPNDNQSRAILHTDGPLFLTAGPGSGKTRVLLWRTLNLLVFHEVAPEEIFLSTFTDKAAFQLKEGLRSLLGLVTNITGKPYDISKMYVGTTHSLCQKLLLDRRLSPPGMRPVVPVLKDALGQYFYVSHRAYWEGMLESVGFELDTAHETINNFYNERSISKHKAVENCLKLFNRLSEECFVHEAERGFDDESLSRQINAYAHYRNSLNLGRIPQSDFSLIQQDALRLLESSANSSSIFKHIIIDEYQDTNTIQERLFFKLAGEHKNICVVGDDDQALYRFRGATVENFVEFPSRCQQYLDCDPEEIPLNINYRSRQQIVNFYTDFIDRHNWRKSDRSGCYRIANKNIQAFSQDDRVSIIASTPATPDLAVAEIAEFVRTLIDTGKVQDPNQIAFLYPSLKSTQVGRMKAALEGVGLRVYAPRAGRFLEVDEARSVFGIYLVIFGKPTRGNFGGTDYRDFHQWMDDCLDRGESFIRQDKELAAFVSEKKLEIATAISDFKILSQVVEQEGWDLNLPYELARMKRSLYSAAGLSDKAKRTLGSKYFERVIQDRERGGNPFPLSYIISTSSSLDWSVLDLFYRLCIFKEFKQMFDLAEIGSDEGPICNMGLITQYLARFTDEYANVITARFLNDNKFQVTLFMGFLYSLFRLGETEYEDANDPFPKGRIPFLTVHQAKGLEFPVVVLGNPRKDAKLQRIEEIVRPLINRDGEPLDRMAEFDVMRMFYVALSRAKNLLLIAHFSARGQKLSAPFDVMLTDKKSPIVRIPDFDLETLPSATEDNSELPRNYSYTSDYLLYQRCPRQYMIFRKYGFVASRSQTMFFGSVVHKTIEDLHHLLMGERDRDGSGN